ncbi:ribosome biogenesis GTPase Der [Moraxella sp. FZLJ2107]|uniref:ribosome biogenesis GTPase Der n=1 Tax=unclassified Moraxella TaxID=2685852 RepID=UPI0020C87F1D|nr:MULTISPECIES: ribosome biogenesis GTPase Der [unclassified Moraxella]UTO05803.1 ribosome biogenesis GTPase Der [Moraxella sp. FZLJ2107]UTO22539.1 ribosome biogenesis GTPase Der [Moraxella sp. FZLJ2109]
MSIKPVVALIGRPNVGKSTLFNQLTKSRQALVADLAGLTRDRQYGDAHYENKSFIVVDTGGIGEMDDGTGNIDDYMATQSYTAIHEADIVVFVVDARVGMIGADSEIARFLHSLGKPVYLVANKMDGVHEASSAEFFALGFGEPFPMAASHGKGVNNLLEALTADMPEDEESDELDEQALKLAIIGRPNVGKSTLVNRLLGEERVVVFDMPGTTRDSIYIPFEREGRNYVLIDTAGVRRRGRIDEKVEKFSVVKTLQAIKDANVVVVVIDAKEGIVDQDLHMLGYALDAGRAIVVAINKWDGLTQEQKDIVKIEIDRRFNFVPWVKIHLISALYGNGVGNLYPSIHKAYDASMFKVSTNQLTRILEDAVANHPPPMVSGRRIKLRYAHLGGHNPPVIVIHGNQTSALPKSYQRYLENVYRNVFKLEGTPLHVEFKQNANPYEGKKNPVVKNKAKLMREKKRIQKFKRAEKKRG